MKKIIPLSILLFTSLICFSQTYVSYNQSSLFGDNIMQQNNIYVNNNNNFGLQLVANAINDFRNSWEDNKRRELELNKFQTNLSSLRAMYSSRNSYPETIVDGWHLAMVTDNFNYCSEAKVYVQDNEIKRFYIDNFYSVIIKKVGSSKIKNGKVSINIIPKEEIDDTVEVYFIYDLDQPFIVDKPLNPGYLTIYSDMGRAKSVKVWIDRKYYGELEKQFEETPECYEEGTMSFLLKPGTYNLKGAGRGTINWLMTLLVREDECLLLNLNQDNKN